MPKIEEKFEEISEGHFGIENFSPVLDRRSSFEELERIKTYSDENMNSILSKIESNDDEEKRTVIVNLIAALDYYVHEIVIWGLVQITMNKFPIGKNYPLVKVSIKYLKEAIEENDIFNNSEIKQAIIDDIRYESYHKWDKIREGLKIVLPVDIESKIGYLTCGQKGITAIFQSQNLEEISEKRHLIVHHFDREYSNNSLRNEFNIDCRDSFKLVKVIIDSIHKIVKEYDETQPETKLEVK